MGTVRLPLFVAACGLALACNGKPEGIMLVISTQDDAPAANRLIVVAGTDVDVVFSGDEPGRIHIHDTLKESGISIGGRDLHADPYRYFIGASPDQGPINVAAIAYFEDGGAGEPVPRGEVSIGFLTNLSIMPNTVLEWELQLFPGSVTGAGDCLRFVKDDVGEIIVTSGTDYDCDGVQEAEDCAPKDGNIAPGLEDNCEGDGAGIDNDCDGECDEDDSPDLDGDGFNICGTRPEVDNEGDAEAFFCEAAPIDCAESNPRVHPFARAETCDGFDTDCTDLTLPYTDRVPCFAENGACVFGAQTCIDLAGGIGADGDCSVETGVPIVDQELCDAFAACDGGNPPKPGPPLECAYDQLSIPSTQCTVEVNMEGTVCLAQTLVVPTDVGGECSIEILSVANPNRVDGVFAGGGTTSQLCGPTPLRFGDNVAAQEASSYEFLLHDMQRNGLGGYHRVQVTARRVAACSPPPRAACPEIDF